MISPTERQTPLWEGRVSGAQTPCKAVKAAQAMRNSTIAAKLPVKQGLTPSVVTRRYRSLTELRTSALLVRESSPLCTDKPEGPGIGLLTAPGETGMPMVNGADRARVLAPLISEREAKGRKAGRFTGGLVL